MNINWRTSKKILAVLLVLTLVLQMGSAFTLNTASANKNTKETIEKEEVKVEEVNEPNEEEVLPDKKIEQEKSKEEIKEEEVPKEEVKEDKKEEPNKSEDSKEKVELEKSEQSKGTEEPVKSDESHDGNSVKTEESKNIEEEKDLDKTKEDEEQNKEQNKPTNKLNEISPRAAKNLGNIFTDVKLTVNGNEVSTDTRIEIDENTTVKLDYKWALEDNTDLQAGDYAEIDIPSPFVPLKDADGDLTNSDGVAVGTYHLDKANKKLRVEFNDELVGKKQRKGKVWFSFEFDEKEFENDSSQEVKFNDQTDKSFIITLKPQGNNPVIDKTGEADRTINAKEITWTLEINKGLEELKNVTVNDQLPEGVELENIEIYDLTIGYNGDVNGQTLSSKTASDFPINFGDINSAYRIEYKTKITDKSKTSFINEATITSDSGSKTVKDEVKVEIGKLLEKKDGKANKNLNATEIDWVINVNEAMAEINNAKLKDVLPDGLTIQNDSIKIYELTFNNSGGEVLGDLVSDRAITNNGDNFEIAFGNIKEAYQVKFTTDVDYSKVNNGQYQQFNKFINTATLTGDGLEPKEDTGIATVERSSLLEKKGKALIGYGDNKTITWTIHVNKANAKIENAKITDTIGEGLELIQDSFVITDSNEKQIDNPKPQVTGNFFTIDFEEIDSSYKIVYKTKITDYDKEGGYNNEVKLEGDGIGVGESITKNPSLNPNISNEFNKKANENINYEDKTMSWKLDIKPVKGEITELKIADSFPNNGLVFIKDSLKFNVNGFGNLTEGTDYTIKPNGENYGKGFILEFENSALPLEGKAYSIEYKTSFDPDHENFIANNTNKYINEAYFTGKTEYNGKTKPIEERRDASKEINNTAKNNGKKEGKLNRSDRTINWQLYLNYMSKEYSEFVVNDEISEGQVIDFDSFVIKEYKVKHGGGIDVTGPQLVKGSDYTIDSTESGFKLTFPNGIDKPYLVEYTTQIEGVSQANYTNKATTTDNNEYNKTVNYPKHDSFVVKEAEEVEGNTVYTDDEISWKVTINESLSEIKKDSVFTDTISTGLVYINDSLEIFNGDTKLKEGSDYTLEVTDNSSDSETNLKVVFKNPINSTYTIKYKTVVISETGKVKNSASFSGTEETVNDTSNKEYTAKQTSGGTGSGVNRGSILVEKKDGESKDLLPGAEFELYYLLNGEEKIVETKTTGDDGKVKFEGLSFRTYYLREVKAPEGYEIDGKDKIEIKVDANKEISKTVENLKKGSLSIVKKDGYTDRPLAGAEFELRDSKDQLVETLVTNEKGEASVYNLKRGDYTLKETKAPEGYILDETIDKININSETLDIEREIKNFMKASISIVKDDGYTNEPLAGAEFEVKDSEGELVDTLTTDEEGKASLSGLRRGMYTIKETKAPDGYELDDTVHEVELNAENLDYTYTVENFMKASISIVKKDGYTNAPLAGAEFEVKDNEGNLVDTLTTDEEGRASLSGLRRGMYTIKETKAPDGYELDDKVHEIELNASNLNYEYTVDNFMKGSLSINKIDGDTEEVLSGVKFKISNESKTVDEILVTDENGKASISDLRRGEYIIQEIEAKEGYVLDVTKHKIELNAENLNMDMTIKNYKHGSIVINKIDGDTENPLAGAEFELRDSEGKLVDTLSTDENGMAGKGSLPQGKYTIKEIKAPKGYEADPTIHEVEIRADELDVQKTVENFMRGSLSILKVEKDTDKVLSGAKFELRDREGNLIETLVTDENGKVSINDLLRGEYTLEEIEAPEGYVLDETKHKIEITSENLNLELKIENEQKDDSKVAGDSDENGGPTMPQTGEMSHRMYYIIGTILLVIGIFLARKKKIFN